MLRFVLKRLAAGAILVVVLSSLAYLLLYISAGNIARNILGQTATEATVEQKKQELGLDQPLLTRFGDWASNALHGDLGVSWFTGQPVTEAMTSRVAVTLSLVIGATVLTAVVSVVLGVLRRDPPGLGRPGLSRSWPCSASRSRASWSRSGWCWSSRSTWAGSSPPATPSSPSLRAAGWQSITLPVIALALGSIAGVSAQIRGSMIDALRLGLRAHPAQPRAVGTAGRLQARAPQRRRPGPVGARPPVRRPARAAP